MDYKKKYEKLVDAVKVLRDNNPFDEGIQNWVNDNVPELKENEDERIKKEIIDYIKTGTYHKKWIAWLEKQGNKPQGKSALEATREEKVDNANKIEPKDYSSIDPYFGKPIDKVESKFKVGDWITNGDYTWKIISIDNFDYTLQNQWGEYVEDAIVYVNDVFHLWTIQDAKYGDVLSDKYNNIGIFQKCAGICWHSYIYLGCGNELLGCGSHEQIDTHPATKEQHDLLFAKMKEAGYEWDAEKKELRKEE